MIERLSNILDRGPVGVTVCGQVIKVGHAGDKAAIALAIDVYC